ncbi:MAG: MFS transporter [Alphaproteobacteria bacterium]|nr:MFS transporter [Alphaproteobacteria bacterium]
MGLTARALHAYSVLALPLAFAGLPLYIHTPDFYAVQYGLSLAMMGIVLMGIRLFDAVQDPLIGWILDRVPVTGQQWVVGGALAGMALGFLILYVPMPFLSAWVSFTLGMILATLCFSILVIHMNARGSLWTQDYHQKTQLTATRESYGLAGLLLAVLLPAILTLSFPADQTYLIYAAVFLVILGLAGVTYMGWMKRQSLEITRPVANTTTKTRINVSGFKLFWGIYFVSSLASAIPAVLVLSFIRDRLEAENYTGLFLILYFVAGIAGMPLWRWLAQKTNKPSAWMSAMMLAVVAFIGAFFLSAGDVVLYAVICVASGLALGADLAIPPSMLSDRIDRTYQTTHTSLFFSGLAFLSKLALALGSGFALIWLDHTGFTPGVDNSQQALISLSVIYALIPCGIKILSAGLLGAMIFFEKESTR